MESVEEPRTLPFGAIVCPSCDEIYDTRDRVCEIVNNSGYCTNITCLEDLTGFSFELARRSDETKRRFRENR